MEAALRLLQCNKRIRDSGVCKCAVRMHSSVPGEHAIGNYGQMIVFHIKL